MTTIKARFDGRVFVPEQAVDLPAGYELEIAIPARPGAKGQDRPLIGLADVQSVETLEQRFQRLLDLWCQETAHHSSTTILREHPAYQEIIALGSPAVPLLLREMEQAGNGHLSHALKSITGACPVLPEHRGRIRAIADDWVRWGKENGYRW